MVLEKQPLVDIQSTPDVRGIAIQQVGVRHVEMPVPILQKDGHTQTVCANVSLSVGLSETQKGTHLSRFIIQLAERAQNQVFCFSLKEFLADTQQRLQSDSAYITMGFRYFIQKPAPVSGLVSPMAYGCSFEAALIGTSDYRFVLGVEVPIKTLCPCSKAISDYGAHNQRALVKARVQLDTQHDHEMLWIEDLVETLEACASCPVYPILKREDEKYVTERAYDNPKFVEDVIREAIAALRGNPVIRGFEVTVEALESIHGHNAWAYQKEGLC